MSHLRDLP
jgi:hypothetical protein